MATYHPLSNPTLKQDDAFFVVGLGKAWKELPTYKAQTPLLISAAVSKSRF